MTELRAPILTKMALQWLREQFPDALLTTELAVAKYGDASLDVAAITEEGIFGVEVKGDGDSAARLARQGWAYGRAALYMWLLPSPAMEKKVGKHKPHGWGSLIINSDGLKERYPIRNYNSPLPNSAAGLLSILWKPELIKVANAEKVVFGKRDSVEKIAFAIAEVVPLATIRAAVCQALLARKWRKQPFPKTVYYPGDALPEISPIRTNETGENE